MAAGRKDFFGEAIVGLFMLAVLSALVYFTIVISGVDVFQRKSKVAASVSFKDAGGLKDHDSVMYRGTKVGTVESISLAPDGLVARIEIDRGVVLREKYRIAVCNLSVLGGNYLLLEEGEGEPLPLESTAFEGETPSDWMRDLASIAKNLNDVASGGELKRLVSDLADASSSIKEVAGRLERGEGTLGKLVSTDDTVYRDLKKAMADVSAAVASVREGKGILGKLVAGDETPWNDLKKTLSSAAAAAERLEKGEGFIGRLFAKDDPIYGEFDAAVKSLRKAADSFDASNALDGANRLVDTLNRVADRLERGEGTLGKILADSELYDEVKGLAKDIRQTVDNFRDTTPISTFGSLIMGGL